MTEKMHIKVEFSEGGLFDGWQDDPDYDGVEFDVGASCAAYANQVEAALKAEYPTAEIEVVQSSGDRCTVDGQTDDDEVGWVQHIEGTVFQTFNWIH